MVGLGRSQKSPAPASSLCRWGGSVESEWGDSGILCVPLLFFCIRGWTRVAIGFVLQRLVFGGACVVGVLAVGLMLMAEAGAEGGGGWLPGGGNKHNKLGKSTRAVSRGREHRGVLQAPWHHGPEQWNSWLVFPSWGLSRTVTGPLACMSKNYPHLPGSQCLTTAVWSTLGSKALRRGPGGKQARSSLGRHFWSWLPGAALGGYVPLTLGMLHSRIKEIRQRPLLPGSMRGVESITAREYGFKFLMSLWVMLP